MSFRLLRILNRIAFTWATLSTLLFMAMPRYSCSSRNAYLTMVKSELRDVARAQEEYHARHGRYAASLDALAAEVKVYRTTLVQVTIDAASAQTWSERHLPRRSFGNVVIDAWLVWLTLLWRQRRAATATT